MGQAGDRSADHSPLRAATSTRYAMRVRADVQATRIAVP